MARSTNRQKATQNTGEGKAHRTGHGADTAEVITVPGKGQCYRNPRQRPSDHCGQGRRHIAQVEERAWAQGHGKLHQQVAEDDGHR